jgi:diadenylate cyclase
LLIIGKSTNIANSRFVMRWFRQPSVSEPSTPLKPIVDACKSMSSEFTGGLIVIAKNDDLEKFVLTGDRLGCPGFQRLLLSIAGQYSPLRDGAVIISEDRIRAARCILPISENDEILTSTGFPAPGSDRYQ